MRKLVAVAAVVMLSACAANKVGPYYNEASFAKPAASPRLSFDEAKVVCRSRNLQHHWIGDTQDLNIPRYTECMANEGYAFTGAVKN